MSPSFRLWNADHPPDYRAWEDAWNAWPQREVFAHPAYLRLCARHQRSGGRQARAMAAAWIGESVRILYPFILRDLRGEPFWNSEDEAATDIASPYGYGGPFAWPEGHAATVAEEFWTCFDAWAAQHFVVSEFVRFSLFRDHLLPYPGQIRRRLMNVVRPLDLDEEALWMDFAPKTRKNIRTARRHGLRIEADASGRRLDDFHRIYTHTLDRRCAPPDARFPRPYFDALHEHLAGRFMYFHALYQNRIVSTELVLLSADTVYSFLGGTDEASFPLRPNELLKFHIMTWAREAGKTQFVLGGGLAAEDSIFRYKKAFAPRGVVPFYTGCRVLNPQAYKQLVRSKKRFMHQSGHTWKPAADFFPEYRA
ncbi:MAG: GNAT family N-acetyltransferase [Rhodothermales bacterium]